MFTCLFLVISCILTLGIGLFIFGLAFCDDIENDLNSIKEKENRSKTVKQLSEFIRYHSESLQLIVFCFFFNLSFEFYLYSYTSFRLINSDFSTIFQPIFLVLFLWSTITICSGMLVIQSELVEYNLFIFTNFLNF